MTTEQICIMISIILYLGIVIAVGLRFSKRNKSADDFYLGGRKLGPLVTAMSAEASDMSSWLLMGLPGVAYFFGIAEAAWTAIGLAIGTWVNWLIVAKKIRRYTHKTNSITLPEFFANRYRDKSKLLLLISAVIIVVFFIPYTASGFVACGKLFSTLFGVDYLPAMIISSLVIVAYTALGGFLAASTTDFIQSIVMSVALVIVLGFGISVAGGFPAVIENARELTGYLSLTATHNVHTGEVGSYNALTIASTLAWGLGYFGMPHILLRFMAINDDKKLRLSRRVATVWVVISLTVAVLIGIISYSMSLNNAIPMFESKSAAESIIVAISSVLSEYGILFAFIAGIILAGILASTMSTADSQLLAASSSVSHNIVTGVFGKKSSPKTSLLIARITVLAIAVIGIFLASNPNSSVFDIVSFAWAGFGATFGPVVLFALFWKRSNRYGALAGMISGGVMVFVWKYLIAPMGGVLAIYELLPAFIIACIAIVVVSLLTPAPEKEIQDEFDEVAAMK
ncbi:MAG: sodium/proline symporter [Lachnospiraceae bacterium]|nr:sodium/proline symporter [Lachnospiraceae bacterium]